MVGDYDLCVFVQTDIYVWGFFSDDKQDMNGRNKYDVW